MGDTIVDCLLCKHPAVQITEVRFRVEGRATQWARKTTWICDECMTKHRGLWKRVKK